jgi:NAD(P)-dependent dehydrogenase (short-subunit alcohol dehydrogenase family)
MPDFAGRLALVTGGLGAIGAATCAALRARGARVVAADAHAPVAGPGVDLTQGEGVHLNVTDAASLRALVARVQAECGPIDTLVNVAGVVSFGAAATLPEGRKSVTACAEVSVKVLVHPICSPVGNAEAKLVWR